MENGWTSSSLQPLGRLYTGDGGDWYCFYKWINQDQDSWDRQVEEYHIYPILFSTRPEEIGIVEGMWMMYGHDEYWLFYSAANFQLPTYRMMVARSKDLMGPYVKGDVPVVETDWERLIFGRISTRPWLFNWRYDKNENCTFAGPGHGSVVLDHSGDWWLIYHSWRLQLWWQSWYFMVIFRYGHLMEEPGRVMLLDKLEWHGAPQLELWPRVSSGVPSDFNVQPPVLWTNTSLNLYCW